VVEWMHSYCIGIQWERTSNDLFVMSALAQMGRLEELRRRVPELLEGARARGDAFALMACRTGDAAFVALADDASERALEEVAEAGRPYEDGDFNSIHYYHLYPWVQVQLYRADPEAGWALLSRAWPALERAGFLRLDCIGNGMRHLRARNALALAARKAGRDREALLKIAAEDARKIARSSLPHTPGQAAGVRAGLAGLRGEEDARRQALEEAVAHLDAAGMSLYAAAARVQLATMLGGAAGTELQAEADAAFTREVVRDPAAFSEILVPDADRR